MIHGGDLTAAILQYGGTIEQWLDLSTGINPWAWPVPEEFPPDAWRRLPGAAELDYLLSAARECYHAPAETAIVAAPGTQALIQWIPRLAPSGAVAIWSPTYNEHERAWRSAGRDVRPVRANQGLPDAVPNAVIVNPNNPDGCKLSVEALAAVAREIDRRGGWLVVDEAFIDVEPDASACVLCRDLPVVVLRSFGKFYGLAGLRLGFAIGRRDLTSLVSDALGPWSCSGPAIHIATRALKDEDWSANMRGRLSRRAAELDDVLRKAGLQIVGGTPLFRLARHADARRLHVSLARSHIWCRKFDGAHDLLRFGLPSERAGLDRLGVALSS